MTKVVITKTNTRTTRSKVTCVPEAAGTVPALRERSVNILTTTRICKCSKVNTAPNKGSKDMFVQHSDHVYMRVFNSLQKSYLPAISLHKHGERIPQTTTGNTGAFPSAAWLYSVIFLISSALTLTLTIDRKLRGSSFEPIIRLNKASGMHWVPNTNQTGLHLYIYISSPSLESSSGSIFLFSKCILSMAKVEEAALSWRMREHDAFTLHSWSQGALEQGICHG